MNSSAMPHSCDSSSSLCANPLQRRRRWWLRWSLVVPVAVLGLALGFQGLKLFRETSESRGVHLESRIPARVPGWRVRKLPLGENESVRNAVVKTLNYDDVLFCEFSRSGVTVGVYVAYWGAGKMPTQLVYSHTPDRCWVENGWVCRATRFGEPVSLAGGAKKPVEWREFIPPGGGAPVYVRYWHLADGKVYAQGARLNTVPHPLHWWRDVVKDAFVGRPEQYFIRLSANVPFETFWDDPGFAEVLRGLAGLGLPETAPEPGEAGRNS